MENSNKKNLIKACICLFVTAVSAFALLYRFIYAEYGNDFPAHIKRALAGRGYSINVILMPLFHKMTGSYFGIVIMMILIIIATILAGSLFMKYIYRSLDEEEDLHVFIPVACSLLFICKICIPEWTPLYYMGSFSTQPWHNSTYIEMRLFGFLALMFYFIIRKDYLEKIRIADCICFSILLFLTNLSKPNFIIAFAPIMLLVLIYDFVATKTRSFKNAFIFGMCVLIACSIMIFQYNVLFPSDGNSSIVLSYTHAIEFLFKDKKIALYLIANYLFVFYVSCLFIANRKKMPVFSKKLFIEAWAMNILSVLISMFVVETGPRAADGNFEWGNAFFALVLFALCWVLLKKMKKEGLVSERQYIIGQCIYAVHVIFGIFYFLTLFISPVAWVL